MPDKLKGHHILLYAGDFARLQNIYTKFASPNFVIRELVRKHCDAAEQLARSREDAKNEDNTGRAAGNR